MKSIIKNQESCYICGSYNCLEVHHVFNASNRKHSEKYGLKVKLCAYCHRSQNGVHGANGFNKSLKLKKEFQELFEKMYSREKFMQVFKKNYL